MTSIAKVVESVPKTRRGRRAASLNDAEMAAAWLNEAKGKPRVRVQTLHAYLERLDGLLTGQLKAHASNEWFVLQSAANTLLARYWFVPSLSRDPSGARRYSAVPRSEKGPKVTSFGRPRHFIRGGREPTVAAALARLYAAGELFHVHRCEHCGCWHARVRRMDRFHSRQCQMQHYTSSDEARERNRLAQERHRKSPGF